MAGSRIVYEGPLVFLVGKRGLVVRFQRQGTLVIFDYDMRARVVDVRHLTPEKRYNTMSKLVNFKTMVQSAITTLLKPLDADSAKEQAVRRLGVAAEIVRLGEADKKKAKTELTKLGIITGGEQNGVVFDSTRYVVTATTKAPGTRLDADALTRALAAEPGLSDAARRRIIAASTVENKAATSFAVEAK